jgi:hypothetical protein
MTLDGKECAGSASHRERIFEKARDIDEILSE